MNKILVLLLTTVFLAACSSNGNLPTQSPVIVDTKGVDIRAYEKDLAECNAYADQVDVAGKAATKATIGGVVAGAIGGIFDGSSGVKRGAGAGAVLGTVEGASEGVNERELVVRRCLSGRGYRILN